MDTVIYTEKQLHILVIAAQEFLSAGYIGASTNVIAQKANVAKGLIFHYFNNKEQLYKAVLLHSFDIAQKWIVGKTFSLSTYMDAYDLMIAILKVKAILPLEEPLFAPLLLQSFTVETVVPDDIIKFTAELKQKYEAIYASYISGLFLIAGIKKQYIRDSQINQRVMCMIEAAFNYEISLLSEPSIKAITGVTITPYVEIIRKGIEK
ncbi:MAG: TetR/AcrR family transcriptional regulator [Culicoidibacterales bacterium]